MDSDPRLDALVEPLEDDTLSGAAIVARVAADVLRRAAVRVPAGSVAELTWALGEVATRVLDAQPAMAPLAGLVCDVLAAVEGSDGVPEGRHAASAAADAFRRKLEARIEAVADHAAKLLRDVGTVATVSHSSTVLAALLRDASSTSRRVLCFESRPMNEGRVLAGALTEAGIDVTYAVDAAMESVIAMSDLVVFGADSVGDRGVVNKIGSAPLARAAAAADVPVYVLTDQTKLLPPGFPQSVDGPRPPEEVWSAPRGVKVWNGYFELVPPGLLTGIVTEGGVLSPRELEEMRARMPFPDVLRRWARAR